MPMCSQSNVLTTDERQLSNLGSSGDKKVIVSKGSSFYLCTCDQIMYVAFISLSQKMLMPVILLVFFFVSTLLF
uniref:Uncharacterized protein n=1 Tax=Anguilla anguilla TaxID=7936 RepID=A0A0E9W7D8_ANGAN